MVIRATVTSTLAANASDSYFEARWTVSVTVRQLTTHMLSYTAYPLCMVKELLQKPLLSWSQLSWNFVHSTATKAAGNNIALYLTSKPKEYIMVIHEAREVGLKADVAWLPCVQLLLKCNICIIARLGTLLLLTAAQQYPLQDSFSCL